MKYVTKAALLTGTILALSLETALAAGGFSLTSPSFNDNDIMQRKYAAKGGPRNCDGENISPAFSWSNAPAETKNFAIVSHDEVGRYGQGVDHWVLYNIAGEVSAFAEGETPAGSTSGKNVTGRNGYLGPCPDIGDVPHHYEFMILALDIEAGDLPDGLSLNELMSAVDGRTLGATSLIGRYARN